MSAEDIAEEKVEKASEEKPKEKTEENSEETPAENPEENSEDKPEEKERKFHMETVVITEAPKIRLITAFVMLSGSGFMAIYTMLQHYEIGAWIRTLLISLVIFFIVGRLFEFLVAHFDDLNKAKEDAISAQEAAIAQREADELAAAEAAAEAERLAAEEAAAREAEEAENQNLPNDNYSFGESDDFEIGDDLSEF